MGYGKITEGHLVLKIGPIRVIKDKDIDCPLCLGQKTIFTGEHDDGRMAATVH